MKFLKFLAHLFIPHESNNQKARVLHASSITLIAVFLIGFQTVISLTKVTIPSVLGYAANISPSEVERLINVQRANNGLSALTDNKVLDSATVAKCNDMLAKGYWAHFAPDGTSPWSFFLSFGYQYKYAGENLARDFPDAQSAVVAWMNSPSHKENILNANYVDTGVGVCEGNLAGVDTTVVVQFFGSPLNSAPTVPVVQAAELLATSTPKAVTQVASVASTPKPFVPTPTPVAKTASFSFVSPFLATKNLALGVVGVLLLILSLDLIIVRRRRIARIGGRTLAHIAYLGMILAVILILKAGQII